MSFTTLFFFFRVARYNKENRIYNIIKTMFLSGMAHEEVLEVIRVTLRSPDEPTYIQGDGALVAIRNFGYPVGEMVEFDRRGHLITWLTNTVKVVYTVDEHGDYEVITSFPLIRRRAREVRIIFPNSKIWPFSMIVS